MPAYVTQSYIERPKSKAPSKAPTPAKEEQSDDEAQDNDEKSVKVDKDATPAEDDEDDYDVVERIEWTSLTLEQKLDILYDICEWHFSNPTRLRQNMKFDDEIASWVS